MTHTHKIMFNNLKRYIWGIYKTKISLEHSFRLILNVIWADITCNTAMVYPETLIEGPPHPHPPPQYSSNFFEPVSMPPTSSLPPSPPPFPEILNPPEGNQYAKKQVDSGFLISSPLFPSSFLSPPLQESLSTDKSWPCFFSLNFLKRKRPLHSG